jgi:DtxR family Mn-dependent transcriptional regulator
MPPEAADAVLTPALEDYVETIHELVRDKGVARVRDIAKARGVKAGSVSPALKRLAELGMVRYERREYVTLSPAGEQVARRVYGRHGLISRFLREVLLVSPDTADRDACVIEHEMSDETMDRLVRLFEFLRACPEGSSTVLGRFHDCPLVRENAPDCGGACGLKPGSKPREEEALCALSDLRPGERGRVARVEATGAVRQRLLDMGLLPDTVIELERLAPAGDPVWIRLQGYQLSLRRSEARTVQVRRGA